MILELQEEDVDWILERKTKYNQFIMVCAVREEELEKKNIPIFFTLQSVSILIIRGQRHLSTVLVH